MATTMAAHGQVKTPELMPAHEPVLLLVPRKTFTEKYLTELAKKIGTPYSRLNCVTLPLWALNSAYHAQTGKQLPEDITKAFLNGGTLIKKLLEKGGEPRIISAQELANGTALRPGELIMRLQPAKNAAELRAFFKAGDNAILVDSNRNVSIISSYKDAVALLGALKAGERIYLTRHYLTAKEGGGKNVLIHASLVAGKTITQDAEKFIRQRELNRKSLYVVVDLGKVIPFEQQLELAQNGGRQAGAAKIVKT